MTTQWIELLIVAAAVAAAILVYIFVIRPWHLRWGATDEEVSMPLPGDELAPARPKLRDTHAITIHAPVAEVWPWLVQMGQGRGGFYSYTWLENLVGCRMRNADRIVPEWQNLKVGDEIWLHPKAPPLKVLALEPERLILLEQWGAFVLRPVDAQTTRFIIRSQGDYNPDWGNALLNFIYWRVIFEPAHFIMERGMMRGVRRRAERRAAAKPMASAAAH
jgi:hypothetical protein